MEIYIDTHYADKQTDSAAEKWAHAAGHGREGGGWVGVGHARARTTSTSARTICSGEVGPCVAVARGAVRSGDGGRCGRNPDRHLHALRRQARGLRSGEVGPWWSWTGSVGGRGRLVDEAVSYTHLTLPTILLV
eukprot:6436958-Pyramimonas_sp.AAC.1